MANYGNLRHILMQLYMSVLPSCGSVKVVFEHFEWEVDPVILLLLKFNSDSLIFHWTLIIKSSIKFVSETLIGEWTRISYEKVTGCFCQVTGPNVQSIHTYKRTIQLNLFGATISSFKLD